MKSNYSLIFSVINSKPKSVQQIYLELGLKRLKCTDQALREDLMKLAREGKIEKIKIGKQTLFSIRKQICQPSSQREETNIE